MDRVFISYRRDDTAREANLLKGFIEQYLDDVAVFIDTDELPPEPNGPTCCDRKSHGPVQ